MDLCAGVAECQYAQYQFTEIPADPPFEPEPITVQTCTLYSDSNGVQGSDGFDLGHKLPPPLTGTCAEQTNPFTTSSGEQFNTLCGQDWNGSYLSVTNVADYGTCAESCGNNANCIAFMTIAGNSDVQCYLISGNLNHNSYYDGPNFNSGVKSS